MIMHRLYISAKKEVFNQFILFLSYRLIGLILHILTGLNGCQDLTMGVAHVQHNTSSHDS